MISLSPYRELLTQADIRQSFIASLLGRLPIGITGLAILLLVQATSGSFARGGAATACYVAGLALIAPALGRRIDRHGPRVLLLSCCVVFPAVLLALVYSTANIEWHAITLALAALAGGSFPPITPCMRTY